MVRTDDPYMKVLLIEEQQDIISFLSLFLSEVKECKLFICETIEEASVLCAHIQPQVILFTHGLQNQDNFQAMLDLHNANRSVYMIVSLPEESRELTTQYMKAGAVDCVVKDGNYIKNLVISVKKALIRLEQSDSSSETLSHADQYILDQDVPDMLFILDLAGKILHWNPAVVKTLGYESRELVKKPFSVMVEEKSREEFQQYVKDVRQQSKFHACVQLLSRGGSGNFYELNCALVENSSIHVVAREYGTQDLDLTNVDLEVPVTGAEDSMPSHLGPYRIVTLLGAGSMGRVYKGYDESLERMVAIKVINKSLAEDTRYMESFRREAKLLAKLTHPNVSLIYYFGNLESMPYFCMEFMPGGSLENLLQESGKFDAETCVSYTLQVAMGLKEALKKGVIHLDIKPSNLMIAENNRVKIVDFGLARRSFDDAGSSFVAGTPFYIAPEQFRGVVPDHRSDIYSLGVTFYRMLYGRMPYAGKDVTDIVRRSVEDLLPQDPPDSTVPVGFYQVIRRMMANDPDKRFKDYTELIQELENTRRTAAAKPALFEASPPVLDNVVMRGSIYDQPFAEILGEVLQRNLSGKLTLSWMDLCKNLHFKDGKIIAVLSNQEGERFMDVLVEGHHLTGKMARRAKGDSFDLMASYDSLFQHVAPGTESHLKVEIAELSQRILQGLFPWMMGEFLFEEGQFRGQHGLEIPLGELLLRGIKEWQDLSIIKQRLEQGRYNIVLRPDFEQRLKRIPISPADTFLLFRFDKSIPFQELFLLSGLPESEFLRLIYLYKCAGILDTVGLQQIRIPPKPPTAAKDTKPEEPRKSVAKPKAESMAPPPPPNEKPKLPEESAAHYVRLAAQSFQSNNYYATVEYCRKALEHKKEAGTYELMGEAFATHPKFKREAMEAYKKALEIAPKRVQTHRGIADLYFTTGDYALARGKYQEVLKMIPDDEHCLRRLAEIKKRYRG